MKSAFPPANLRPLLLSIALIAAALLAVACSDDDTDDATATTAPSVAATTAAPEPTAAATPETQAFAFPQAVTDSSGEEVTLAAPPRRIISYSPGATEVLFAIGGGDQVVATDQFSDYPAAARDLPKLEYTQPAPEPALALEPDLVIMAGNQEGQVAQFRSLSLTVLFLREPPDLQGVIDQVRLLGGLTGNAEAAQALASDLEARLAAVAAAVADVDAGPLVFVELSPDGYSVGPDSFIDAMLGLVRARNVGTPAGAPFPILPPEVVIEASPDVILLLDAGDFGGQTLETVAARPGWDTIGAVQAGRVHEVDSSIYSRPGPRAIEAVEELVSLLYPD